MINRLSRVKQLSACCALAFAGLMLSVEAASPEAVVPTDVCSLSKAGKQMHGQRVRLKAVLVSDLMHSTLLKDRNCPAQNVAPFDAEHGADASVAAFQDVLRGNLDDFELRVFAIDVSGVFRWNEAGRPQGELVMEKVWNFERHHGDWREVE
jgi:hypothetical protein